MDLTVAAVPVYFGSMGAEYLRLRARAATEGPSAADYERRDTIASLSMGVGSLLAPLVMPKLLGPVTPGKGRYGRALVYSAAGSAALTTVADLVARTEERRTTDAVNGTVVADGAGRGRNRRWRRRLARLARKVAGPSGVAAVVTGGLAATTWWATKTSPRRMWDRRATDLGGGMLPLVFAVFAWDFLYYWNHRFMHESRFMWAIHEVHHSSQRYNLSTALRQPVADAFGVFVPYTLLALVGVRPEHIATARGVNLLYQFWIHTDTIDRLGPTETVMNTPSHHRVHHGRNRQYLDRNHGSILIVWDRLFGTFEPEGEEVVYGLTRNIDTFDPARIATHEHADMLRDVAHSRTWRDRLSFVFRGPGWSYRRKDELEGRIDPQRSVAPASSISASASSPSPG